MTEKELLKQLEKKLNKEYDELDEETKEEIEKFAEKIDKNKKDELEKKEYKKYLKKIFITSALGLTLIKKLSRSATDTNVNASKTIYEYMPKAYKIGFDGWIKELNVKYVLNMSLADKKAIEHILKGGKLLPDPKVDIPKDLKWNERRMRSSLLQSVVKGESIPDLSKRLENAVGMNRTSAIRNARTMAMHSFNVGRYEAGKEAIKKGIDMDKEWIAHIDDRTRQSHREINGEVVPYDEPFSNGLMFPQDFDGDPAEVYNCRCRLGYVVK